MTNSVRLEHITWWESDKFQSPESGGMGMRKTLKVPVNIYEFPRFYDEIDWRHCLLQFLFLSCLHRDFFPNQLTQ